MDETIEEGPAPLSVGQQLREAREGKKLSLEDVAAATRIPTRHLSSLETGEWDKLPAPTYAIGFAKNYAGAVGLDRAAIADQLREEMGGYRPAPVLTTEYLEVSDPKRSFPKGLVFGALALLALALVALVWANERQLQGDADEAAANEIANADAPAPAAATAAQPIVTLAAIDNVWLEIKDGQAILKQGEMKAGESFQLPPNAIAPAITTGKPEALRVTVGDKVAAPLGEPGKTVTSVSLKASDLLAVPAPAPTTAPVATQPSSAPAPRPAPTRPRTVAAPKPAATQPAPAPAPAPTAPAPSAETPPSQPQVQNSGTIGTN